MVSDPIATRKSVSCIEILLLKIEHVRVIIVELEIGRIFMVDQSAYERARVEEFEYVKKIG